MRQKVSKEKLHRFMNEVDTEEFRSKVCSTEGGRINSRLFFDPGIPGSDLVEEGLSDIQNGRVTSSALLVLAASPRLQRLGMAIPNLAGATSPAEIPYEHQLYDLLGDYSLYNSLLRRISSYASTLESRRHANENSQPMPQPFSVDKFPR